MTIRLICWKEDRAAALAAELDTAGFTIDSNALDGPALRALGQSPPDAVVIDLDLLPAQGRDIGVMLRTTARSRHTPLVFVDGPEAKVARTRVVLPDASCTSRNETVVSIRQAIANPPVNPVVPESNFAGLVDFKICAIDATWSGLCFTRRKK